MLWSQEELSTLRSGAVLHLKRQGLISDNEVMKPTLFTCDICNEAEECEWAFHHDSIRTNCVREEVKNEEG